MQINLINEMEIVGALTRGDSIIDEIGIKFFGEKAQTLVNIETINQLREENKKLRDCVEFYADIGSWQHRGNRFLREDCCSHEIPAFRYGLAARKILKEKKCKIMATEQISTVS